MASKRLTKPEAAMRTVLAPRATRATRLDALKLLTGPEAQAPPIGFIVALLRRPYLLFSSSSAHLAAKLLKQCDAIEKALSFLPSRPAGLAAVRASVILSAAVVRKKPDAALPLLLNALCHAGRFRNQLVLAAALELPPDVFESLLDRAESALGSKKNAIAGPALGLSATLVSDSAGFERLLSLYTRAAIVGVPVWVGLDKAPAQAVVDICMPLLERSMRKDRASTLRALPGLFVCLGSADLSDGKLSPFLASIVDATQTSDQNLRALAQKGLGSIAARVRSDPANLLKAGEKLALSFKSAKYAYQRTAAAGAIVEMCKNVPDISVVQGPLLLMSLGAVTRWLVSRKETGDEARECTVRAIADIMGICGGLSSVSDDLAQVLSEARKALADVLMDKKTHVERRAAVSELAESKVHVISCLGWNPANYDLGALPVLVDALVTVACSPVTAATAASSDSLRACVALLRSGALAVSNNPGASESLSKFCMHVTSLKSPIVVACKSIVASASNPPSPSIVLDVVEDALALVQGCEYLLDVFYSDSGRNISLPRDIRCGLCASLVQLACDVRPRVRQVALPCVRRVRSSCQDVRACMELLEAFYVSVLGDPEEDVLAIRSPYDFDDGGAEKERLSQTLNACVLPASPTEAAPLALLSAHHPRLYRPMDVRLQVACSSHNRSWLAIQKSLPEVSSFVEGLHTEGDGNEAEDENGSVNGTLSASPSGGDVGRWIEATLHHAVEQGLQAHANAIKSGNDKRGRATSLAAVWGIANLVNGSFSDELQVELYKRLLSLLLPLCISVTSLSEQHWEAFRSLRALTPDSSNIDLEQEIKPLKSKGKSSAKTRAPPQGSAAAAAAERLEKSKIMALETRVAIAQASAALEALLALCSTCPESSVALCPAILSVSLQATGVPELEEHCRNVLLALAKSFCSPLKAMALDIASSLYRLGAAGPVKLMTKRSPVGGDANDVARLVVWLKGAACSPPLSAEGFALVAPIVKESMVRDPAVLSASSSRTSAARAAAAGVKKEAIAVSRAGTYVLAAHCKPEALDAAVAAAGARAGTWALAVLEREDAAFGIAADALAALAGTALSPGSSLLSQVLGGVVSGKSSVREAALTALERIPALSMDNVSCPRDSVLGRTLWLGMHDPDAENAVIAKDLWEQYGHPLGGKEDSIAMLALLAHVEKDVRVMTARAVAESLVGESAGEARRSVIPEAFTLYLRKLPEAVGGLAAAPESLLSIPRQRLDRKLREGKNDDFEDEFWYGRHGVALLLRDMADRGALVGEDISLVFAFLASRGLGDPRAEVRGQMASAARSVVSCAGSDLGPSVLLPMIELHLNTSSAVAEGVPQYKIVQADRTRENLVVCLGCVAEHLPVGDSRKASAAAQIIKTATETPSETVQSAAARCIVPLASSAAECDGGAEKLRKDLQETLWNPASSYGERRGASYALAGIMRGLGIKSVKTFGVLEELEAAAKEKDNSRRQGAFIAMETMAVMFGRLYEPYTVRMLPIVLASMGDNDTDVRDSCWKAARASMAEVSSLGVKMILPSLLSGLNERQWRTKVGAAEVLGAMAFCAPRQLSECLPQVVPRLAEALADAHPKVVEAAESAIGRIAAVAKSPEVRNLSRFLLAALKDPAGRTGGALDAMLGTAFVHAIDPASLALLIPPLHRGLRDRSPDLKKRAAAIVGSMCDNVSNHQDVAPYLDLLLPDLRATLLDAIPDVRRTSARAIGALAVALGESGLPSIVPWLVGALLSGSSPGGVVPSSFSGSGHNQGTVTVSSSAERSGAAVGLAEVCAALSDARIEEILAKVLNAGDKNVHAREGGLMLLASLPRALGDRYEDRLGMALASILRGLADDSDGVREAAMDAGRKTVSAYAKTSLESLLPELLAAMRDTLWRIRYAATQLLGDFLLVIAGALSAQGQGEADGAGNDEELLDEEDEDEEADREGASSDGEIEDSDEDDLIDSPEMMAQVMTLEATMKAIEDVLGIERRNEVLAALYIIRCDAILRVRQMGMQVWKTVVSNTPRVLREIMPCAVRQVIVSLSDEDEERRVAAGKALADLSQKLGDRVVPEVLPALRASITDSDSPPRVRLGACEGLAELVAACPNDKLMVHGEELLEAVCDALRDSAAQVRFSGAEVFASLLKPLGSDAVNKVVPLLISKISGSADDECEGATEAEIALDSMKKIISASGPRLLSIVVPQLLAERPLTAESCRALSAAASASAVEFEPYVQDLMPVLIESLDSESKWSVSVDDLFVPVGDLLSAVTSCGDQVAVQTLETIVLAFNEVSPSRRLAAATLCSAFCQRSEEDVIASRAVQLFEVLIRQLSDADLSVVTASWKALGDLTTAVPSSRLSVHVGHVRQALRSTASGVQVGNPGAVVAGLNIPKGPAPLLPVFTEALLNGSPSIREQAALAIADLAEMTNAKILSSFAIKLTGPLIRVVSERVPWQVKAAILRALLRLLEKSAALLRTFAPQLQSSFLKCLADSNRLVRVRACAALGALVPVQPRVESLLKELVVLCRIAPTEGTRTAAFVACAKVFKCCKKLPASAFLSVPVSLVSGLEDDASDVAKASSLALGALSARVETAEQYVVIWRLVLDLLESEDSDYDVRVRCLGAVSNLARAGCHIASSVDLGWSHVDEMAEAVANVLLRSTAPPVLGAACSAAVELYMLLDKEALAGPSRECRLEVLDLLSKLGQTGVPEVRVGMLLAAKKFIANRPDVVQVLAESLVTCAGSSNTGIRDNANRVLRRAFVISSEGVVNNKMVAAAKEKVNEEDADFIDRRLPKLLDMPDSDTEEDLTTADD